MRSAPTAEAMPVREGERDPKPHEGMTIGWEDIRPGDSFSGEGFRYDVIEKGRYGLNCRVLRRSTTTGELVEQGETYVGHGALCREVAAGRVRWSRWPWTWGETWAGAGI